MIVECDTVMRLDLFLVTQLKDHSRSRISQIIAAEGVKVDGKVRRASYMLRPGMRIELDEIAERPPHDLTPADIELDIHYEDDLLLVVNKPRGMVTHPAPGQQSPTLVNALLARSSTLSTAGGAFRPGIVHRLDKETTGLLIVAKTDAAHRALAEQIRVKSAERRYVAAVANRPDKELFVIDAPIGRDSSRRDRMAVTTTGKPSRTQVKFLREAGSTVQLAVRLETGRTHQIRVHLAAIGLPVLGDRLYNAAPSDCAMQLHAGFIAFDHPRTGERIALFVPPPQDYLQFDSIRETDLSEWPLVS